MNTTKVNPFTRAVVAAFATLSVGAVAGCSETTGDEQGASVEDIQEDAPAVEEDTAAAEEDTEAAGDLAYDGIYDAGFYSEIDSYAGQQVTVSAEVEEIISDQAFTIAGDDVEALLVVGASDTGQLAVDSSVEVTGTVQTAFDLPAVEEQLGTDLDDELYAEYDQEPYVMAENIDATLDEADGE